MVTSLVWTLDGYDLAFARLRDLPMVLMHHPMMPMAQENKVLEIGRSAMDPVHEVMSIAP
jgi:hypothetical protein